MNAALPPSSPGPGETGLSAYVFARGKLNATGIVLNAGRVYDLQVVEIEDWRDWTIQTDADGFEKWYMTPFRLLRRVRRGRWFQLAGQIGEGGSTTFLIRSALGGFQPSSTGALLLFTNDVGWAYGNNHGVLRRVPRTA